MGCREPLPLPGPPPPQPKPKPPKAWLTFGPRAAGAGASTAGAQGPRGARGPGLQEISSRMFFEAARSSSLAQAPEACTGPLRAAPGRHVLEKYHAGEALILGVWGKELMCGWSRTTCSRPRSAQRAASPTAVQRPAKTNSGIPWLLSIMQGNCCSNGELNGEEHGR